MPAAVSDLGATVLELVQQDRLRFVEQIRADLELRLIEYDTALRDKLEPYFAASGRAWIEPSLMLESGRADPPEPEHVMIGPSWVGPTSTAHVILRDVDRDPLSIPKPPGASDAAGAEKHGEGARTPVTGAATPVQFVSARSPDSGHYNTDHQKNAFRTVTAASSAVLHQFEHAVEHAVDEVGHIDRTSSGPTERKTKRGKNLLSRKMAGTFFERLVDHPLFEMASGTLIMFNVIVMSFDMQYKGYVVGHELDVAGYSEPGDVAWPNAGKMFEAAEVGFNVIFFFELLLRLGAAGKEAFNSAWMWIDAMLVLFSVLQTMDVSSVDPSMMRLIRLLRLLRLVRMVRTFGAFDALFLIVRALQLSGGSFVWSFVVLFMMELGVGMIISQMVLPVLADDGRSLDDRQELFKYFGTWSKTMLTMMEVTIGNFIPVCRALNRIVSEWYSLFFILYRGMFMFCTVKVISAVFIAQLNKAVANDDALAINRAKQAKAAFKTKLEDMFIELDHDGDGILSEKEFVMLKKDDTIREWGASLGINTDDIEELWHLLSQGDDKVERDAFLAGISNWAGQATAKDVVRLLGKIAHLSEKVHHLHDEQMEKSSAIVQELHNHHHFSRLHSNHVSHGK